MKKKTNNKPIFARGWLSHLEKDLVEAFVLRGEDTFIEAVNVSDLEAHGLKREGGVLYGGGESITVAPLTNLDMVPIGVLKKVKAHPRRCNMISEELATALEAEGDLNEWVRQSTFFWIRQFIERSSLEDWWSYEEFMIPLFLKYRIMTDFDNDQDRENRVAELVQKFNPADCPVRFGQLALALHQAEDVEDFEKNQLDAVNKSEIYTLRPSTARQPIREDVNS